MEKSIADRESLYADDVLQASTRRLRLPGIESKFTFGTLGEGMDLVSELWPEATYVWSCQAKGTIQVEKSLAQMELGPPNRTKTNTLVEHPVDIMLVGSPNMDCCERWLQATTTRMERPSSIVQFLPSEYLSTQTAEKELHLRDKRMRQWGYNVLYWFVRAHSVGASLHQDRLVVVYFLEANRPDGPRPPQEAQLPPRPMGNLLRPTGIHKSDIATRPLEKWKDSLAYQGPGKVVGTIGGSPVYGVEGVMPDNLSAWVKHGDQVRRLQVSELAKAKGFVGSHDDLQRLSPKVVRQATCLHLLCAVGDEIVTWMQGRGSVNSNEPYREVEAGRQSEIEASTQKQEDSENIDLLPEWKLPDLRPGGEWYNSRVASLRRAAQQMDPDNAEQLIQEGLQALEIHRNNYTEAGPQRLQLLWWEFPREHWEALKFGSSMNFLITPSGTLELNSPMTEPQLEVAARFVDELVGLGVLVRATEPLQANGPLFLVPKPGQPGEWRCISDMKRGGQNGCIGRDPTYLPRAPDILPRLYKGGYSAVADASKHFYNFPTRPDERKYLGCIHPLTQEQFWYVGLPMGSGNSPAVACRLGNSCLRQLREESRLFQGTARENSWRQTLRGHPYESKWGHGRVLIGEDGLPAVQVFAHVDDYLIHGPTKQKTTAGFHAFMDMTVRLGFICQPSKTRPPAQCQKFCGFIYDTTQEPTLRIPEDKVSRALASIAYLRAGSVNARLARLTLAIVIGRLQSLVDATPQRIGNTYLRRLYDELHAQDGRSKPGRAQYFSVVQLSDLAWQDLSWWETFLALDHGATGPSGRTGAVVAAWGDGSGTGTGGTLEFGPTTGRLPEMEFWMGTWSPRVHSFSSNWRELRTVYQTLLREKDKNRLRHHTLFYFTDNLVSYYIILNGASSSPELHTLVLEIKRLELLLGCHLEVVHVPGTLMIRQGTDGLSRGLWIAPERLRATSVMESSQVLEQVPFTWNLGRWAELELELPHGSITWHGDHLSPWDTQRVMHTWSIWTPTPETARQALAFFLDLWVETPLDTGAIFLIPRVLQRTWSHVSQYICEHKCYVPALLPAWCTYPSEIPFILLYIPPHIRRLPRVDEIADGPFVPRWIQDQITGLHGVS